MRKNGAGILFSDGQSILLLKRSPGTDNPHTWGIPGGKIKKGETFTQNAHREVKEETGLKSIPGKCVTRIENNDEQKQWIAFFHKIEKPFNVPKLSHEHEDWAWIKIKDLPAINLHPSFRKQVNKYIRAIRREITESFSEWVALSDVLNKIE